MDEAILGLVSHLLALDAVRERVGLSHSGRLVRSVAQFVREQVGNHPGRSLVEVIVDADQVASRRESGECGREVGGRCRDNA
jgi:hypothetical protein